MHKDTRTNIQALESPLPHFWYHNVIFQYSLFRSEAITFQCSSY